MGTPAAVKESSGTCHPKIWSRCMALMAARKTAKNRLEDLVRGRKTNDAKLDELGAGEGPDHLKVSRLQILTLRSIEYERARIRELADRIENAIEAGIQHDLEYLKRDGDDVDYKPAAEAELFQAPAADPDEGDEGDDVEGPERAKGGGKKPVGRHPQLKLADVPPPPEGVDQQLTASINELDLRENLKGKLLAANLPTIGSIAAHIDKGADLGKLLNVGENAERDIKKAVGDFRSKHREAARSAEGLAS